LADELSGLLADYGIFMRKSVRSNGIQLYTKDSTIVEDLLTLMGAGKMALELMDTKVEKSVKNNINRARNCDDASISKTVEASIKQRMAIEYLEKSERLYSLPQELLEAALLRKNNPEASLKELCRIADVPLTVSGLNHRLSKIIALYEEAKGDG
jgi:DNA-binding protein WhiA